MSDVKIVSMKHSISVLQKQACIAIQMRVVSIAENAKLYISITKTISLEENASLISETLG